MSKISFSWACGTLDGGLRMELPAVGLKHVTRPLCSSPERLDLKMANACSTMQIVLVLHKGSSRRHETEPSHSGETGGSV